MESTNNNFNDDRELLRSLNKLSIATSPSNLASRRMSTSPNSTAQSRLTPSRLSSVSPSNRAPSRSPVLRTSSSGLTSQSRSGTPTLLRKTSMNSLHSSSGITPSRALSRRSSSNNLLSPTVSRSPLNGFLLNMEEKPLPTPASVASAYLEKELEMLHGESAAHNAETIVILHDACYGHRFSRTRSTKADLHSIVERPERIQASVLGLSMAYVRLGERHCDGKYPIHPELDPTSLPNVPFRIRKTNRSLGIDSTAVTNVHGTKWMEELKMMCDSAEAKLGLNSNEVKRPDINRGPHASPPKELHKGDLYLCSESLNAFEGALGAVCDAVDEVFSTSSHKRAFVAVRPPGHHCSPSHPSGFCWVNNVQVGIMHGFLNHGLTHAAIIDFDLHHGDGSQAIAWDHNKRSHASAKNASAWKRTSIGYFSIHDINSYPCEWGDDEKVRNASVCIDNAHGQNIWNVHLQEWKSDVEFWKLYQSKYSVMLEKARAFLRTQTERYRSLGQEPKAAIFLSAGFDASEWESAGMQRHKVNVPTEFYARITRDVVRIAAEEGLGVEGRIISVLEGGYSDRALCSGVLSHLSGLAGVEPIIPREELGGLGYEVGSRIGSFSRRNTLTENEIKSKTPGCFYDPDWWSASELDQLDAAMTAIPQEQPPKRPRSFIPGNYSSPTQASSAKAVDPSKVRRSVSGYASSQMSISRPPTPPPPDVPWTAAAHELSKLLIPKNRQVDSFRFEELNAATKAKRERQSLAQNGSTNGDATPAPAPVAAPVRKSLRERKPVSYAEIDDPKTTRRRTVGGSSVLATEKASSHSTRIRQPSNNGPQALARGIPTQNDSGVTQMPGGVPLLPINRAASAMQRPSTSLTMRPDSSMSVRTQASALNVKKTRPGAPARKESSRAPRRPKTAMSKPEAPLPVKNEPSNGLSADSNTSTPNPMADMDNITNSMKKIKINVLTKEKKEARQKAEADKKATDQKTVEQRMKVFEEAKNSHVPINGNAIPPVTAGGEAAAVPTMQFNAMQNGYRGLDARAAPGPALTAQMGTMAPPPQHQVSLSSPVDAPTIATPVVASQPLYPRSSPVQSTAQTNGNTGIFVPYQPSGPTPTAIPFSSPVQILEPNTDVPQVHPFGAASVPTSPARRGHAFTSTSNIPFSPRSVQESHSTSRDNV
ncbi:hypothetical protein M426DRAFT_55094 [Hypoxylon sp. CI-4A]|nr:hypothetical protein M426DRAFT_55094 [Hypoxylon sp. CI-4A]